MTSTSASPQDLGRIASAITTAVPALHRALDRRVQQDFPLPKPSDGQMALLRLVREHDAITVRKAAEALLMKPNNVSALVSQMVVDGLLERRPDAADKRVIHLCLTDLALSRVTEVEQLMDGYVVEALHSLSDGERAAIGSALSALRTLTHHLHPAAH
ncbi:MarR family winged helix-turn-helix transcriptional regulator [uncultured Streptomyces sp.]|uniref:MarR family winged helix-turn-helix transcriptional regulator n=1 Tax=uncultured Streptomyces sp. TaxID=174707 RepID=UPI00260A204C|nr:MarR family transcriptional regulator [uncultured Streptomyces sp.]